MRNSDQLSLPFAVLTSVTGLTTQMFLCLAVLIVIIAIHIYTLILFIVLQHTKTPNVSIITDCFMLTNMYQAFYLLRK